MDKPVSEKISSEISMIDTLLEKSDLLVQKCKIQEPDFIELNAVASVLHSYYNGLENIFLMIGKNIDNATFSSQRWHKELLDSMFASNENRPAVLTETLHDVLFDYMSFRHVFRHSYGFFLDWTRLQPLFFGMCENWKSVKSEILKFIENQSEKL